MPYQDRNTLKAALEFLAFLGTVTHSLDRLSYYLINDEGKVIAEGKGSSPDDAAIRLIQACRNKLNVQAQEILEKSKTLDGYLHNI